MALNREDKPDRLALPPLVFADFDVYRHKQLVNPIELAESFIQDKVIKHTHEAMASFKEKLEKKHTNSDTGKIDHAKVKEIYDIHFMVNYDQELANETFGEKWLKCLLEQMRYPSNTEFLNCPNLFNLKLRDQLQLESACTNQDLFVTSGFLKPGKHTIRILDN